MSTGSVRHIFTERNPHFQPVLSAEHMRRGDPIQNGIFILIWSGSVLAKEVSFLHDAGEWAIVR